MTYDYFKTVHGRNGIRNDGQGALSRVHYSNNYANAYCECVCWLLVTGCSCMSWNDADLLQAPLG